MLTEGTAAASGCVVARGSSEGGTTDAEDELGLAEADADVDAVAAAEAAEAPKDSAGTPPARAVSTRRDLCLGDGCAPPEEEEEEEVMCCCCCWGSASSISASAAGVADWCEWASWCDDDGGCWWWPLTSISTTAAAWCVGDRAPALDTDTGSGFEWMEAERPD